MKRTLVIIASIVRYRKYADPPAIHKILADSIYHQLFGLHRGSCIQIQYLTQNGVEQPAYTPLL